MAARLIALMALLLAGTAQAAPKAKKPPEKPVAEVKPEVEPVVEATSARGLSAEPAISEEDFRDVLESIHDAGSRASARMSALQLVVDGKRFNMEQVGKVVDLFSFSDDKINVVRVMRPGIVDRSRVDVLLPHFQFATDKQAVQKILDK